MKRIEFEEVAQNEALPSAVKSIYHKVLIEGDKVMKYRRLNQGEQAVIELGIRVQRWFEAIVLMGRIGLDGENRALARFPFDLHLNQLYIQYTPVSAEVFSEPDRLLTVAEKGELFYRFSELERLDMLRNHREVFLATRTEKELDSEISRTESELKDKPLICKNPRQDWHGLTTTVLAKEVLENLPPHHAEFGVPFMKRMAPSVVAYMNKGLHTSGSLHKAFREAADDPETGTLLTDRRSSSQENVDFASFLGLGSLMAVGDALDIGSTVLALIRQELKDNVIPQEWKPKKRR